MGLPKPALRFLALEHQRRPFTGKVLMLGRQGVFATLTECRQLLIAEGLTPQSLYADFDPSTNIPHWKRTSNANYTSDVAFMYLLGVRDCRALDYSDYEGAELVCDLNEPVPDSLVGQFDVVIDSGTLEHVFNVRQSLENVSAMLKIGGRVIHFTPANNFANHGFYQFSPTLYADFYRANQFGELRVYVADEIRSTAGSSRFDMFELDLNRQPGLMLSPTRRRMLVVCVATKLPESTGNRIPIQSSYVSTYEETRKSTATSEEEEHIPKLWFNRMLWRLVPRFVYRRLRNGVMHLRHLHAERTLRRPWGLRYWRRL